MKMSRRIMICIVVMSLVASVFTFSSCSEKKQNMIVIGLNYNGANINTTSNILTIEIGEEVALPTPYRTGSVFRGWYNADTNEKVVTTTTLTSNCNLIAKFEGGFKEDLTMPETQSFWYELGDITDLEDSLKAAYLVKSANVNAKINKTSMAYTTTANVTATLNNKTVITQEYENYTVKANDNDVYIEEYLAVPYLDSTYDSVLISPFVNAEQKRKAKSSIVTLTNSILQSDSGINVDFKRVKSTSAPVNIFDYSLKSTALCPYDFTSNANLIKSSSVTSSKVKDNLLYTVTIAVDCTYPTLPVSGILSNPILFELASVSKYEIVYEVWQNGVVKSVSTYLEGVYNAIISGAAVVYNGNTEFSYNSTQQQLQSIDKLFYQEA